METQGTPCLRTETKEFVLEAYGKNRQEAVAAIFSQLKTKVYAQVDGLILQMEPVEVYRLREEEKTKTQKFLGFFMPRAIQNYYVQLRLVVMIKYI